MVEKITCVNLWSALKTVQGTEFSTLSLFTIITKTPQS